MGNSIMCHRIAIGLFYIKAHSLSERKQRLFIKFSSIFYDFCKSSKYFCNIILLCLQNYFNNNVYAVILIILIRMCMDVELNPGPNTNDLSIFHLNIRSVRNKLSYIEDIASEYNIISLTETHLDNNILSCDLQLDGFNEPFRADKYFAGGGILVYVSEQIKATRIFELEFPHGELIWLQLDFPQRSILLCTIYRPPNTSNIFWEQ